MKLQTYQQILEHLKKEKREKHLLMGNGFSIAYDQKIFSYNALSDFIKKSDNSLLIKLFEIVNTYNFEQIMQQLNMSKKIISVFDSKSQGLQEIDKSIELLKEALISAVKALHPEYVFSIPEEKSTACARFLSDYLGTNESIFTTNYDILLYWVLMRNEIPNCIDGFGRDLENDDDEYIPEEDLEYSELRWGKHKDIQNIFYLHGALPIFDTGIDIINDFNGFTSEGKLKLVEKYKPALVVMNNGRFDKIPNLKNYLEDYFDKRVKAILETGIEKEKISIDPGVGYSSNNSMNTPEDMERIKSVKYLRDMKLPMMVAISRKSFNEKIFGLTLEERLMGTLIFESLMVQDGGRILRVHDVKETRDILNMLEVYNKF